MSKRLFMIFGLVLALVVASMAFTPSVSRAQCRVSDPDLNGAWNNVDPNTRGITRVDVRFQCGDYRICDESGRCYTPRTGYYIHVYGACHPYDCDWGEVEAYELSGGHVLYARYDHGFAQRSLFAWVVRDGSRAGQLAVYWSTHFTDGSGRRDYSRLEHFYKVP